MHNEKRNRNYKNSCILWDPATLASHSWWFVILLIFLLTLLHLFLCQSNVCISLFNCHDMFKDVTTHELQIVAWQRTTPVTTGKQQDHSKNPPGRDANKKIKKLFARCSWRKQGRESRLATWPWLMVILVNATLQTRPYVLEACQQGKSLDNRKRC